MQFHSLGWKDPLEEDMVTGSSVLAWRTPRAEEPGGCEITKRQAQLKRPTTHSHRAHFWKRQTADWKKQRLHC